MKRIAPLLLALAATPAFAAGDPPARPITIAPGAIAAVVKGSVKGYATAVYTLDVAPGQTLQALFKPSNRSCYFNATANGAAEAEHVGSSAGNEFGRNITAKATYRFDIYLMRNAARRKETCRYQLSVELTGAPGGASAGVSDLMMRDMCKGGAARMYGVEPRNVTASAPIRRRKDQSFMLDGTIDKGAEGVKKMRCLFGADRTLKDVMALTPDGE